MGHPATYLSMNFMNYKTFEVFRLFEGHVFTLIKEISKFDFSNRLENLFPFWKIINIFDQSKSFVLCNKIVSLYFQILVKPFKSL